MGRAKAVWEGESKSVEVWNLGCDRDRVKAGLLISNFIM